MGLWLEHRDEKGNLVDRARFFGGIVMMMEMSDGDSEEPLVLSVKQAQELAKMSSHLPAGKRDWTLRIDFGD